MAEVKVEIIRIVDKNYPMYVEFELIDCNGIKHLFIDKVPAICQCEKYGNNPLCFTKGCTGTMRCSIDSEANNTFVINTEFPDDIESGNKEYIFEVRKEQIINR